VLSDKCVLVTGGTGSLGQVLVRRLLDGELGDVARVIVFSRDEAKQHAMRLSFARRDVATDDVIYERRRSRLRFVIGDVRDRGSLIGVLREADVVVHAAALKQVPTCEYHPREAVMTNIGGTENLIAALHEQRLAPDVVVGVSTDKACKPVNVMGMTKALQERMVCQANLSCPDTRFVIARYGNVLASRGSVLPLFHEQIRHGGPVTVTTPDMTRFLMSLDEAVDLVFAAVRHARAGETYVPRVPSARVVDLARALIADRGIDIAYTGIRPGEKVDEILVSEEEAPRTSIRGPHFAIAPALPELRERLPAAADDQPYLVEGEPTREYSSAAATLSPAELSELLSRHAMAIDDQPQFVS
jgi:UDP-glucose 4-epimerase